MLEKLYLASGFFLFPLRLRFFLRWRDNEAWCFPFFLRRRDDLNIIIEGWWWLGDIELILSKAIDVVAHVR